MISLQVMFIISAAIGLFLSYLEFRRAQFVYEDLRSGVENGLSLQIAAHQVRVSVGNAMIQAVMFITAGITLFVMWARRFDWDLVLVMLTGLAVTAVLQLLGQLMYRYDRALIMDTAVVKNRAEAKK